MKTLKMFMVKKCVRKACSKDLEHASFSISALVIEKSSKVAHTDEQIKLATSKLFIENDYKYSIFVANLPVCQIIISLSSPPEAKNVPLQDHLTLLTHATKTSILHVITFQLFFKTFF